jgi:hypothetical protein
MGNDHDTMVWSRVLTDHLEDELTCSYIFDASRRVTTIVIVTHTTNDIVETPPVG